MSTWCRAPDGEQLCDSAATDLDEGLVESFVYPAIAGGQDEACPGNGIGQRDSFLAGLLPADRLLLEERLRASEKAGWERGIREGEHAARDQYERFLGQQRAAVSAAVKQFAEERQNYFRQVEGEVVQLALAIARKILHREAQLDPMLLAGLVRYSLAQLDAATMVKLRVHAEQQRAWQAFAATEPQRQLHVVADVSIAAYECTLETEVGSLEISVAGQLKEIEQGFFDLLRQRPKL